MEIFEWNNVIISRLRLLYVYMCLFRSVFTTAKNEDGIDKFLSRDEIFVGFL